MRVVVARIDRPFVAGARMGGVQDAIQHGIAQVDVARRHIDFCAQHPRPVRKLARLHAAEQIEVFRNRPRAERAVLAGLGQRAAVDANLFLRLVVDIGKASANKAFRPFVQALKVVGGIERLARPLIAEPAHVGLDGIDIFLLFLGRIGVVEAQIAAPCKFLRDAEIERDRFGMTDMQIAVRFRGKPGHDLFVPVLIEIGLDDVANEIAPRLGRHRFCRHSQFLIGLTSTFCQIRKVQPRSA